MKRCISLLIALMLTLCGALPACAAGAMEITDDTWYVVSHSDDYRVYYYAAVKNTGSKAVSVNNLLFEIQDSAGDDIESTAKYKLYPEVLEAGQTGWLAISRDVKDIDDKSVIDHYDITITTKTVDDKAVRPFAVKTEYLDKDEDDNENVIRASVTNDRDDIAFDVTVASAVFDKGGKLLYVAGNSSADIGFAAGGSFLNRFMIRSDVMDEIEKNQLEIASADSVAYIVEDLDD